MRITSVTIGIPVSDLEASKRWYEEVFELSAVDLEPADGVVEYEIGGCWLQLGQEGVSAASETAVRFGVDNVIREQARLARLGVQSSEVEHVEGAVDFFEFRDPDGNLLSMYSVL